MMCLSLVIYYICIVYTVLYWSETEIKYYLPTYLRFSPSEGYGSLQDWGTVLSQTVVWFSPSPRNGSLPHSGI